MSPRDQERTYKKEYSKDLVAIAQADLESAELLAKATASTTLGRKENVVFLVQQAIEKSIKAVICWNGQPVPLVHDLGTLVAKLPGDKSPPEGYGLSHLNEYATVRRYEKGAFDLTDTDISTTLDLGRRVIAWAMKELTK